MVAPLRARPPGRATRRRFGYALAQVLPLRQISTTDSTLDKDITNLASAYETVYKTNGKKGTEAAVNKAGKKLGTICPGAF